MSDDNDKVLEWSVYPFKKSIGKSVFLALFLVLLFFFIYSWLGSIGPTVIIGVLFLVTFRQFFTGTRYVFYSDKVEIITPFSRVSKNWNSFRSYYPDKNGVLLSPFGEPSRLENFRGIYLLFDDNKEKVIDFIKEKVKISQ